MTAEWIYEYTTPAGLLPVALLLALGLTALSALRHLPRETARPILLGLRVLFLLLLAWTLLQPARRRSLTEWIRPRFAVLLDTSASMRQGERADAPEASRWAVAQEMLSRDWVRHLGAEAHIDLFAFDAEVGSPLPLSRAGELRPEGQATRLRDSLNRVVERYRGQDLLGLLLLSDGIDTRETTDEWSQIGLPAPVYAVQLEDPFEREIVPDVRVESIETPRRVVVDWESRLSAVIAGQPVPGEPFPVRLLKDGALVEEQPVQLPPEGGTREIAFRLRHPQVGSFVWTVDIPRLTGESNTNDNHMAVAVEVVDARNQLLYIEDIPRWDSRFLNRILQANPNITPLSFVRGPDGRFIAHGERGAETLDLRPEQLRRYTMVILGDLDAETLGAERAEALRDFAERGGSLVLLGGAKAWGADGLGATALAGLFPVRAIRPRAHTDPERLRTRWSDEAAGHPAFTAADTTLRDQPLPPLLSVFVAEGLTAAATVLVEAETPAGWSPVAVSQPYGQGRVLMLLTDSLWRWQLDPNAGEPYAFFWNQTLEWLSPADDELDTYALELIAEVDQLFPDEQITLTARLSGLPEATQPDAIRCRLLTPDGRTFTLNMPRRRIMAAGRAFSGYGLEYAPTLPGAYRAEAEVDLDGQTVTSTPFFFRLHAYTQEALPRPANEQVLRNQALTSGGRYGSPDEIDRILRTLRTESRREHRIEYATLWRTALLLGCLMGLLVIEWILRKKWNMV